MARELVADTAGICGRRWSIARIERTAFSPVGFVPPKRAGAHLGRAPSDVGSGKACRMIGPGGQRACKWHLSGRRPPRLGARKSASADLRIYECRFRVDPKS